MSMGNAYKQTIKIHIVVEVDPMSLEDRTLALHPYLIGLRMMRGELPWPERAQVYAEPIHAEFLTKVKK